MNEVVELIEKVLGLMFEVMSKLSIGAFGDHMERHEILRIEKKNYSIHGFMHEE